MPSARGSRHGLGLLALGGIVLLPEVSEAHFVLQSPPASTEQNVLGDPQKAPPCGDDGTAVATGTVTSFAAGDTITVTIDETIFHPGHYRIALAVDDVSQLPDPPPVTPGSTPCGSAPIDPAPAFPVLADGVFEHTEPFGEPQSIEITLPEDLSCTACTLQVIQFMSNHALNDPGGCYYHHCATLAVEADPPEATSAGDETGSSTSDGSPPGTTGGEGGSGAPSTESADEDTGPPPAGTTAGSDTDPGQVPEDTTSDEGCGCSLPTADGAGPLGALLALLGLAGLRRRGRRWSART